MSGLPPCPHCRQPHAEDVLLCPNTERLIPLEGRVLDAKFRFVKMLGEGGMGAVWMCENVLVKKTVAIKLMHVQFSKDEGVLARFRNEATAAGRIGSKHICDILDLGRSQLGPYIVMEMLDGADLAGFMQERSPVDHGTVVMAMRQALEGLQAAHAAGIVHRDLKPENIFLHEPEPGQLLVKLMDFGISKFTEGDGSGKTGMGVLMGTPEYMSPEQTEGAAQADHRTDIWAMGVILYWALAGRNPFMGATMASTLLNVTTREVMSLAEAAPNLPPGLVAVVQKCIRKNPEERFSTAAEMSAALEPFEDVTGAFYVPFLSKSGTTGRSATRTPPPGATVASSGPPPMRPPSAAPAVAAVPVAAAAAAAAVASKSDSSPMLGAAGASGGPTFSSELSGVGGGAQPTMAGGSDWSAAGGELDDHRPDSNMGSGKGGMLVIALVALALVGGGGWLAYGAMQAPDPTNVAANAAAAVAQQEDDAKAEAAAEAAAAEAEAAIPDVGAGEEDSAAEAGEAEAAEGGAAEAGDAADSAAAADAGGDAAAADAGGDAAADDGGDAAPDDSGGTKPKPSGGGGTKPKPSGGGGTKPKPDDGGSTPLTPSKPARPTDGKKKKGTKKKKKKKKKKKG